MFSWKWKKVYSGFDREYFLRIQERLEQESIEFRTRITNPAQDRMVDNALLGGNPLVLNRAGTGMNTAEYTVLVKKQDSDFAEGLVQRLARG